MAEEKNAQQQGDQPQESTGAAQAPAQETEKEVTKTETEEVSHETTKPTETD